MHNPPAIGHSQMISTRPYSGSSFPEQLAVDDLESGLNYRTTDHPVVSAGLWKWITPNNRRRSTHPEIQMTPSVPDDVDQSATTTQRDDSAPSRRFNLSLLNNFPAVGLFWPRSGSTSYATDGLVQAAPHPVVSAGLWITSYLRMGSTHPDIQITTSVLTSQRDDSSLLSRLKTSLLGSNTWHSSQGGLPVHSTESRQRPQPRWEKTVISLTFQAVVGLTLAGQPPTLGDQLHHLHFFGMLMLLAFASSFSATLLDRAYPGARAPRILEKMGYIFAALGFYLVTGVFLPNSFTWIFWVASAFPLVAFTLTLKTEWDWLVDKMRRLRRHT